jgi:hypothetical protein
MDRLSFLGNIASILVEDYQRSTDAIVDRLAEAVTIVIPDLADQRRDLSFLCDWCIGHFLQLPRGLTAELHRWYRARHQND